MDGNMRTIKLGVVVLGCSELIGLETVRRLALRPIGLGFWRVYFKAKPFRRP